MQEVTDMLSFDSKHESREKDPSAASRMHGKWLPSHNLQSSFVHSLAPLGHRDFTRSVHAPFIQTKLTINTPGDAYEREADHVADQVMRATGPERKQTCSCGGTCPDCQKKSVSQVSHKTGGAGAASPDMTLVDHQLRSAGQSLDTPTRHFMESRFGHDFGRVRVHADRGAAESASSISARAYTSGEHIVFGHSEYSPGSDSGRWLLAHELTHVMQQGSGGGHGMVQRAPTISVVPENFIGPLTQTQRRAAATCSIDCCHQNLGTLNAMPLFYHENRGAVVAAGSPRATGIGSELHFTANDTQPPADNLCHCDNFRMIQVITTNNPAPGRGNSYVDNLANPTPFYGDIGLTGRGEHSIPGGYVDAGEKVKSTESIYDRPSRTHAELGTTSLNWMAETCVACIKNTGPDRILGGVTYGFTQNYNAGTSTFDSVVGVGPSCVARPSDNFIQTLGSDPSTSTYNFQAGPGLIECFNPMDDIRPKGDTRLA
jgi:hypothetical protein